MENKTISQLNERVWYRFIKVVYLFIFLATILITNGIIILDGKISRFDLNKSTIYCKNGKSLSLNEGYPYFSNFSNRDFENGFNYQDFSTEYSTKYKFEEIAKKCGSLTFEDKIQPVATTETIQPIKMTREEYKTKYGQYPETQKLNIKDLPVDSYRIVNPNEIQFTPNLFDIKLVYTYTDFIKFFLIANLIILFIFELIRRVFYYIVLGSIKPKE